jgi:hypothetical protein
LQEVVDDNLDGPRLENIRERFAQHCDQADRESFPVRAKKVSEFQLSRVLGEWKPYRIFPHGLLALLGAPPRIPQGQSILQPSILDENTLALYVSRAEALRHSRRQQIEVEDGEVSEESRRLEAVQACRLLGRCRTNHFGGQPGARIGNSLGSAKI